jgi:hypothetical protein
MVRARRREHLQAIFPGEPIRETQASDYKFRVQVSKEELTQAISREIAERLTYDNFKNSIEDHTYHDACSEVWRVMHRLQPGSWMPARPYYQSDIFDTYEGEPPPWDDDLLTCPGCSGYRFESYITEGDQERLRCEDCGTDYTEEEEPNSTAWDFGNPDKYDDDDRLPSGME